MKSKDWEDFYRSGSMVSCPTDPEPYYTLELREAWERFFAKVDDRSKILDLGTGNGAVALIAKETAEKHRREVEIHGVDLAAIDPFRDVPGASRLLAGIRFHAGVSTESLPFDDQSFAAVGGQYIMEYTDAGKTLAETWRVLQPGGACQFILHHEDSLIVRNAYESLRQADLVFNETKVLRKLRRFCTPSRAAPTSRARQALIETGETLQSAAVVSTNPLLLRFVIDSVSALLANRRKFSAGQLLQETDRLERNLRQWVHRLRDLTDAAPSERNVNDMLAIAEGLGFAKPQLDLQKHGGTRLVGWRVCAERPG